MSKTALVLAQLTQSTNSAERDEEGKRRKAGVVQTQKEPSPGGLLLPQAFFPETFSYLVKSDLRILLSLRQRNALKIKTRD